MRGSSKSLTPAQQQRLQELHSTDEAVRLNAALQLVSGDTDVSTVLPALQAAQHNAEPATRQLIGWILMTLSQPVQRAA